MKKFFLFAALFAATTVGFVSCDKGDDDTPLDPKTDSSVVINGVRWATRNVDAPGTFAAKPESYGKFYQWNRKTAWCADCDVAYWDSSEPSGDTWEKANDPSPAGWRMPTLSEIESLLDADKVTGAWTLQNGAKGWKFTDKTSGRSVFFPAVGYRDASDGKLDFAGSYGNYWSSVQLASTDACSLGFTSTDVGVGSYPRGEGQSVRAVAE